MYIYKITQICQLSLNIIIVKFFSMELNRLIYNHKKEITQPGIKTYYKIVLKPYRKPYRSRQIDQWNTEFRNTCVYEVLIDDRYYVSYLGEKARLFIKYYQK